MRKFTIFCVIIIAATSILEAQTAPPNLRIGIKNGYAVLAQGRENVAKFGLISNVMLGYRLNERFGVGLSTQLFFTVKEVPGSLLELNVYLASSITLGGWYHFRSAWCRPYLGVSLGPSRLSVNTRESGPTKRLNLSGHGEVGLVLRGATLAYGYSYLGKTPKEARLIPASDPVSVSYHSLQFGYSLNF